MLTSPLSRHALFSACLLLVGALSGPLATARVSGPTIGGDKHAARPETVAAGWLERRWAQSDLERLTAAVETRIRERGPLPPGAGFEALIPDFLPDRTPTDPWGQAYRLVAGEHPAVVSAGPDGKFGSGDDLRRVIGTRSATAERLLPPEGGSSRQIAERLEGLVINDPVAGSPPSATPPAGLVPPKTESAKSRATRSRMREIAEALTAFREREGHYPEHDDATRLLALLGLPGPAEDAWGRRLSYLSLAAGSRCVLASRGEDGRFGRSLEEYLRGGEPAGDLVFLNARER